MSEKNATWWQQLETLLSSESKARERIYLWGPPGTGKSSWPLKHCPGAVPITLDPSMLPDSFFGSMFFSKGNMEFRAGPVVQAMRSGGILVLNEVDHYGPEMVSTLYSVLDDNSVQRIQLPDGKVVKPADGFAVIATSNRPLTLLPEALQDRFRAVIHADIPAPGILSQFSPALQKIVSAKYARNSAAEWSAELTARTAQRFAWLAELFGPDQAAILAFGSQGADFLSSLATADAN